MGWDRTGQACWLPPCPLPARAPCQQPTAITETRCPQGARASQNNLCILSVHENITVLLKEHNFEFLAREASKNRLITAGTVTTLGTTLIALENSE